MPTNDIPCIPEITFSLSVMDTVQAPVDPTLSLQGQAADAKATGDAINAVQTLLTAAVAALFPVGSVYCSVNDTAPAFYGTWTEITMPATWGDLEDGNRSYADGTGTGNLHFWRRTA
jgi:hypothetical protein